MTVSSCPVCEPESYYGDKNGLWVEGPVCDRCQAELGPYASRVDRVTGQDYYFPMASNALQCVAHVALFEPMLLDTPYTITGGPFGPVFERNPSIPQGR